ncbi:MAG: PEP-CTERM sorting domain-containing protein [Pseudomonadota bacterium]
MAIRNLRSLMLVAAAIAAAPASATVVQGNSLQNGLNNVTYGNSAGTIDADFYDVNAAQIGGDAIWSITSGIASGNSLILEFAGFANNNSFGIYDIYDSSNTLEIFSGSDSAGSFEVALGLGNTFISLFDGGAASFTTSAFGYYLSGPGGNFYSQAHLNPGGADQMVAYQGDGDIYIDALGYGATLFGPGDFILAWEDLPYTNSDGDYEDFVVLVSSVTPIPAPAALGLLGFALMGLGLARRRRA